jgi:hypothetical protein
MEAQSALVFDMIIVINVDDIFADFASSWRSLRLKK